MPNHMIYRALGRTGMNVSVVGLGGHWRTHDGRRYYDRFDADEVPAEIVVNRTEVVAACADAGINYLDITTAAEAVAYGRVLGGRRERFIVGADDYQWSARNPDCCKSSSLIDSVDRILSRLRTDHLDIWRVTSEVHGCNTDAQIEAVIAAADELRASGKIRFLGISAHHPAWIQRAVERFSAIDVAIVPCTALGCGEAFPHHPPEPMRTIVARGLGLMTIKPLAGGLLFGPGISSAAMGGADAHRLARLTLQYILQSRPEISSVLMGMSTVEETSTAVEGAAAVPLEERDRAWLESIAHERLRSLPPDYAWLAQWHR